MISIIVFLEFRFCQARVVGYSCRPQGGSSNNRSELWMISIIVLLEFRFCQARMGLLKRHVEFADGVESKLPPAGRQFEQSIRALDDIDNCVSRVSLLSSPRGLAQMARRVCGWRAIYTPNYLRGSVFRASRESKLSS